MSNVSPDELRTREKRVESFDKLWLADPNTLEIKLKPFKWWQPIVNLFWKKRHKVSDMYWWVSKNWATDQMIAYPDAIEHDSIPSRDFPRKYRMKGGWTIPKKDLQFLYEGPLLDEVGNQILVKHQSRLQAAISILTQLRPLTWIIGFIFLCVRFSPEIQAIYKWVENVL
jgi:hypothetical protein